jgi:predicted RNA binding protein YcfA (HicA-like mRNA interferase family)
MSKLIKTKNLIRVLTTLGFEQSSKGSHGIFRQRESGVIVTLPLTKPDLPPVYSRAILGQVISSGLVSEEELNKLLISN